MFNHSSGSREKQLEKILEMFVHMPDRESGENDNLPPTGDASKAPQAGTPPVNIPGKAKGL